MPRHAVRRSSSACSPTPSYPSAHVGETSRTSPYPISSRTIFMKVPYWPNRHGPLEDGMKSAIFPGAISPCTRSLSVSPSVTFWGRHSSPEEKRPPRRSVSSSEGGMGLASIPTERNAAEMARTPASVIGGKNTVLPESGDPLTFPPTIAIPPCCRDMPRNGSCTLRRWRGRRTARSGTGLRRHSG